MKPRRLWLHPLLFIATAATTYFAAGLWFPGPTWVDSALFSGSVLLILGAHEMGHYALARYHHVDSSLPYFIPFPFGFGTFGAVIRLRGQIPNRNALVDIGAAGPLAGLFFALPLMVIGLMHAKVVDSPPTPSIWLGPQSLVGIVRALLQSGEAPNSLNLFFGDNLLIKLLVRLIQGELAPGKDVLINPVFLAAWFGLLMTSFNLFPIGQLDAGHLTHAWFGRRAERIGKLFSAVLLVLAVCCSASWTMWWLLTRFVIGFKHPTVTDLTQPLSRGRKLICTICFAFLVLTLMPVPLGVGL